jgi:hypothetical protein
MSRITIHSILGSISSFEEFYRTSGNHVPSDIFKSLGLIVNYNENYLCEALEFFAPAELFFDDIVLLDVSYKDIFNYFLRKDPKIEEDDSGFITPKYGIGAYAPYKADDPLEKIESVIVFKRNYYS